MDEMPLVDRWWTVGGPLNKCRCTSRENVGALDRIVCPLSLFPVYPFCSSCNSFFGVPPCIKSTVLPLLPVSLLEAKSCIHAV